MLIIGSILLLLANAVTLRRDKSIIFNRVAILILLYSGILAYDSLAIGSLDTGIGVFSGLFHSTAITHSFDIFIYIMGAVILQLRSFYSRRLRTVKLTLSRSAFPRLQSSLHYSPHQHMTLGYLFKVSAALFQTFNRFISSIRCDLVSVLQDKFGLACSVNKHTNGHILYIPSSSKDKFVELVKPYILPVLYYKLGLCDNVGYRLRLINLNIYTWT